MDQLKTISSKFMRSNPAGQKFDIFKTTNQIHRHPVKNIMDKDSKLKKLLQTLCENYKNVLLW